MSLELSDKEEIQRLLDEGKTIGAVALIYKVPEPTLRNFVGRNNIVYQAKRKAANTAKTSVAPVHQNRSLGNILPEPANNNGYGFKPEMIPLPNTTDPSTLNYLLQLKNMEASTLFNELQSLKGDYRRIIEENQELKLDAKHHARELQNTKEDAERNKETFGGKEILQTLAGMPGVGQGLGRAIEKFAGVAADGVGGSQLGGVKTDNPDLNEFIKYLQTKDTDTIHKIISVGFKMVNNSEWLTQAVVFAASQP
jgi:hypothetical protein